jgi:RNA polymerase sigma-70 factor, ECF subfamily
MGDFRQSQHDPKLLMAKAKEGDHQAFTILYEMYFTPIYKYIYVRVSDKLEAEDLAQEVFLKVFKTVGRFNVTGSSPLSFFYTVARNTIIDAWRKKRDVVIRDEEHRDEMFESLEDKEDLPDEVFEKNQNAVKLHDAIGKLTREQQEVVTLKFIDGLGNKEIAEVLGKKEDAIRQLQSRALKALGTILKGSI